MATSAKSKPGRPKQTLDKKSPAAIEQARARVWQGRLAGLNSARDASRALDAIRAEFEILEDRALQAIHERGRHPTREEYEAIIAPRRQAEAPHRQVLFEIDRQRAEQDASDLLPFGDRAMEQLRVYRARRDELKQSHGERSAHYLGLMKEFVGWYNRVSTEDRMCERCSALFALTDARARFCSDKCSAAQRMRGRPHDGRSEVARTERVKRRAAEALSVHVEGCRECKKGEPCTTKERELGRLEAYTQSWSNEALEAASARQRRR